MVSDVDEAQAEQPQQPSEEQLRELFARADMIRQQLMQADNQREMLSDLNREAHQALTALEHLVGAKQGDEMLVPLGAGAFVQATLGDPNAVLTSIGSSLHTQATAADAVTRMTTRVASLDKAVAEANSETQRLSSELQQINAYLEPYLR